MSNIDQQKDLADLLRLAKALNAVEMLHVRGGAASLQRSQSSHPTFQYLIIIDFEATCWSAEDAQKWRKNEIIEFPAVLLNLSNGQIESEFRQYVMPIENPRLSEFCTQLTGIRQDQVEGGVPLHTCLSLFDSSVAIGGWFCRKRPVAAIQPEPLPSPRGPIGIWAPA
ncbi:hypothetical protein RP20_CCG014703 [Aedes albopictus]|nr:hypothetical protein RP20_CCG014703 [Aedes albopictus]